MTKRNWILGGLGAISLVVAAVLYFTGGGEVHLKFTQNELQQRIDTKLSQRAETEHKVTVSQVTLDLTDDKIGLDIAAQAVTHMPITHREVPLDVSAHTRGTLFYDNTSGSFYFAPDKVQLKNFEIGHEQVSDKVGKFIDKWATSPSILEKKEQLVERAQEATDKGVQYAVTKYLRARPVYTLPSTLKGQAARMALKSVVVQGGEVSVTLSVGQALLTLLGLLGLGVLLIGIAAFLAYAHIADTQR